MERWKTSKEAQNVAEERLHELQNLATHASPNVRDAVERSFVRFYEFTGRLNQQLHASPEHPQWRDLVIGLTSLEQAIRAVASVITPRLRDLANEEVPLPPSLLGDFAQALEAQLQSPDDSKGRRPSQAPHRSPQPSD
jgi:hypothetical protein